MDKYFEIINLSVPCPFILQDGSRIDLRLGIPKGALDAYKTGFEYLGLKPDAAKLLKKESEATIMQLIRSARRKEDVEILALSKPDNKDVQEVAGLKLQTFNK